MMLIKQIMREHPDDEFIEYAPLLEKYALEYRQSEKWIYVGKAQLHQNWIIFISVIRLDIINLLEKILPILVAKKIPFKIVKNQALHQLINIGRLGHSKVGKVIVLYSSSQNEAIEIVSILAPLTAQFRGPKINNTIRLGNVLYGCYSKLIKGKGNKTQQRLLVPARSAIPFYIGENYHIKDRRKFVLRRFYILMKIIRISAKGNIYKVLNTRDFVLNWCIIKQGRLNMVDDFNGRTIKDRLRWQKEVHTNLNGKILIPKIVEFFEEDEDAYLVMEYIKGIPLESYIKSVYRYQNWNDFLAAKKIDLLNYYIDLLQIVEDIHKAGYVHRDLKHGNFLRLLNGKPYILDFELSYSFKEQQPNPPFTMISPGYQAPEQLEYATPTIKEDIYSLGALLIYLITGTLPKLFIDSNMEITKLKLRSLYIGDQLIDLACWCMLKDASSRPTLRDMIMVITGYIQKMSK